MGEHGQDDSDEPVIRFGGEWVPAHAVWKKMETTTVVVDAIDNFNEQFPHLATDITREVVPTVRERLKQVEVRMPRKSELPDLSDVAAGLLGAMSPEDALETLSREHGTEMDMQQFIQLAGEQAYLEALYREAAEFADNRISPDQTSQLWNDLGRPAPGGGLWTEKKVQGLLDAASA